MLIVQSVALAQSTRTTTSTDGATPLGKTPGAPDSSYALSGFDNINYFNGHLNFHLPLHSTGGRGGAAVTSLLTIENTWRVQHIRSVVTCSGANNCTWKDDYIAIPNDWKGIKPGYGPGVLQGRGSGYPYQNVSGCEFFGQTLTRLTFTTGDGTEYEFRDSLTQGQPQTVTGPCSNPNGPSRGTLFYTADGTSATFISDAIIYDTVAPNSSIIYPSGYMLLKDGTRYRIDNGRVTWIRDRNGNQMNFTAGDFIDPLGRHTTIAGRSSNTPDGTCNTAGNCDQISYPGTGGTTRTIQVAYNFLHNALRTTQPSDATTVWAYNALFPHYGSYNSQQTGNFDPIVASSVILPDGNTYQFKYNQYGELARVVLPTGGAYEYDYVAAGTDVGGVLPTSTCPGCDYEIYRRFSQKRIYDSGNTLKQIITVDGNTAPSTVDFKDAAGNLLVREKHYYNGAPTQSFSAIPISYPSWGDAREYQTEIYSSDGTTLLRRKNDNWQQRAAISWWTGSAAQSPANDPRIVETTNTLTDYTPNLISKQSAINPSTGAVGFDQYNNQTDVYDYDYGGGAVGPLMRHTHTDYLTTNSYNGNIDYTSYTGVHIKNLPASVRVMNSTDGTVAYTEMHYDEGAYPIINYGGASQWTDPGTTARGNATTVARWLNTSGGYYNSHAQYDIVGNVIKAWDAKGNLTQYDYTDSFSDSINRSTYALPKTVTSPVPDSAGTYASNTSLVTSSVYDYSTGHPTSTTDPNNQTTTYEYAAQDHFGNYNQMDRLTRVNRPDGGWTRYAYAIGQNVGLSSFYVNTQTAIDASRNNETYLFHDGLGRPIRTFYNEYPNFLVTDTQYDAMGRVRRVSNPYRTAQGSEGPINPSGLWTTSGYDALSRPTSVTTPDNAIVQTSYLANSVTVIDQMNRMRRSWSDGAGRLIQVVEDQNGAAYQTNYSYDVLNNLRLVTQGTQQRFFMYDSLSRLIRAKNPEQAAYGPISNITDDITGNNQWAMAYAYDENGNLMGRTDPRGVSTNYTYDTINRNTTVRYTDSTAGYDNLYDYPGIPNCRGHLHATYTYADNNSRSFRAIYNYDAVGRPKQQDQVFMVGGAWGPHFGTFRTYDLAGNVLTQTYPSGHTVNYAYDHSNRLNTFSGNLGDGVSRTYVGGTLYSQWNSMAQEQFGTAVPLYNKLYYNNRGQMSQIRVSTYSNSSPGQETNWNRGAIINHYSNINWAEGGTDDNGNLQKQDVYIPNDDAISAYTLTTSVFAYDALNRLSNASELRSGATQWQQAYTYDRWGNRTINTGSTYGAGIPNIAFNVDSNTNRLLAPNGTMGYDNAGNLTNDSYTSYGGRTYDAENRMLTAVDSGGGTSSYVYDSQGKRVRRRTGGQEFWQVYGMDGELVAEYTASAATNNPQKEYGYRNGQLLVTAASTPAAPAHNYAGSFDSLSCTNIGGWAADRSQLNTPIWVDVYADGNLIVRNFLAQDSRPDVGTYIGDNGLHGFNIPLPASLRNGASHTIDVRYSGTTVSVGASPKMVSCGNVTPNYAGSFDSLDCNTIYGWVADRNQLNTPISVDVYDGSTLVMTTYANTLRTDVGAYLGDNGYHGFNFTLPASLRDGVNHSITLRPNGSSFVLGNSPRAVTCGTPALQWLVSDQLGTPRMAIDVSGSLSGVKRHDYLPFGEEIGAGTGGRTSAQGYSIYDGVRQKFALKERDNETGIDYFEARYYASAQGRFTSPDEFAGGPDELFNFAETASTNPTFYADLANPQSLNKYQYTYNNPLRYTDPKGHCPTAICIEGAGAVGSLAGPMGAAAAITFAIVVDKTIGWDKVAEAFQSNDLTCPECQRYNDEAVRQYKLNKDNAQNSAQPNENNKASGEQEKTTPTARERRERDAQRTEQHKQEKKNRAKDYDPRGRGKIQSYEDAAGQEESIRAAAKVKSGIDSTKKSQDRRIQKGLEEYQKKKDQQ